jgi:hypothetical protein
MSSNQNNYVEQYAWVDEALENAWSQAHFEEEDEALNQETFGPAEESVGYIPMDIDENSVSTVSLCDGGVAYIPMDIHENSVSTISLGDEDVYDYEYDDFSVAYADEQGAEAEAETYEYAAAAGDAYGYAAPVEEYDEEEPDDDALNVAWDVPIWYRQTTRCVLNDGTVVYNGHADGQRVHDDDDDEEDFPLLVVQGADDAMGVV